jgi:hypothetical protein
MKIIFLKLSILFFLSIIPVAFYNYHFDPYGIFNNRSLGLRYEPGHEPNQHYAKIRHLLNDKHQWDSYVFGSSRVGKINPDLIDDGHYYNMNYSEGVPREHLADIRILLKKGIPVKNVIIGLDSSSYTINPEEHRAQIMRHPYDDSAIERFLFQLKYLCSPPKLSIMKYIRPNNNELLISFDIVGNGAQNLKNVDMNIDQHIENHINNERFHMQNQIQINKLLDYNSVNMIENTIHDIKELMMLSGKNNFNLSFFINPIHELYYLQNEPYCFLYFKKRLAQVTAYWDFSGINSVTSNNYYYYETSHYRSMVGDLIVCRMTKCPDVKVPEDFGVFVTMENVSRHIKAEEDNLIAYNNSIMKKKPKQ